MEQLPPKNPLIQKPPLRKPPAQKLLPLKRIPLRKIPPRLIPPASRQPPRPARKNPPPPKPPPATTGRPTPRKITTWTQRCWPTCTRCCPAARSIRWSPSRTGSSSTEYYREGYDEQSLYRLNSASKSFTSALIGIAIEQGYIGGVDDLLSDYLPQVLEQEDTRKHQITLEHLLTHTSGLEWYEWGGGYSNWVEFQTAPNWVDYILGRNLVYDPGTQFAYSTGNTHLLSAVLEAATGMTEEEYARINLFEPLGIENWQWDTDPQGITDGGNGLHLSTRDAARFGQLFLQNGQWNGQQLSPLTGWRFPPPPKTAAQGTAPAATATSGGPAPTIRAAMTPTPRPMAGWATPSTTRWDTADSSSSWCRSWTWSAPSPPRETPPMRRAPSSLTTFFPLIWDKETFL